MRILGPWAALLLMLAGNAAIAATHRVAILPADPSGGTSKEILRTVNDELTGLTDAATGVDVVAGPEIKKKVRVEARSCKEDPPCLAKLGRRLKVDEVVTVRARTHGNGLRLTFVVIGVEDRRLRRSVSVNIETVDGIAAAVRIRLAKILGVNQAQLYAESQSTSDEMDDDLLALAPLAPLPGADEIMTPEPAKPAPPPPVETVVAEPTPRAPSRVAVVPPVADPTTPRGEDETSSWMWYSGLGLLGAGAVLGGVSTFFGVRYLSKKNALDADGETTPQVLAEELGKDANNAARSANITAIVAGVVAAGGAGLLIADLVSDDVAVSVSVAPERTGASVVLFW